MYQLKTKKKLLNYFHAPLQGSIESMLAFMTHSETNIKHFSWFLINHFITDKI